MGHKKEALFSESTELLSSKPLFRLHRDVSSSPNNGLVIQSAFEKLKRNSHYVESSLAMNTMDKHLSIQQGKGLCVLFIKMI